MKPSYEPVEKRFRLRLMSPLGRYPANSFCSESAALIVSPEVCFSIVRVPRGGCGFSELDCLTAFEIPLYGSILLSGEAGSPYLYPYPTGSSVTLKTQHLESIDEPCIRQCRSVLLETIQRNMEGYAASFWHKPPALGGMKYDIVSDYMLGSDRLSVLYRLETANPLILRGVNCLLKAHMAFQHGELSEAACIYLWIALDAAHSMVLQKLRETGVVNPTSSDAVRYFEKWSGYQTEWDRFFEDDYENRIRAIHPDNRFGAEAIPQFLVDDFYQLNELLIPFFHFFVSELPDIAQSSTADH
jgi:hypothetical protein